MREIPRFSAVSVCIAILLASHAGAIEPPDIDNERDDVRAAMSGQMKRLYEIEQASKLPPATHEVEPAGVNQGSNEERARNTEPPTTDGAVHKRDDAGVYVKNDAGVWVKADDFPAASRRQPDEMPQEARHSETQKKLQKFLAELARLNIQRQSLESAIETLSGEVRKMQTISLEAQKDVNPQRANARPQRFEQMARGGGSASAAEPRLSNLFEPGPVGPSGLNQKLEQLRRRAQNLKAASRLLKDSGEDDAAAKYMKLSEESEKMFNQEFARFKDLSAAQSIPEPVADRSAIDDLRTEIRALRNEVAELRSRMDKN